MKIQCTREDINNTVNIKKHISALKFLSPIEVRKLQMFVKRGEEAFFVSIPKPWFRNWGYPEEISIRYAFSEEPRKLFIANNSDDTTTLLKKIGSSYFFEIDSNFIGSILPGTNVLLEHFGSYVEVIFPNKFIEKQKLVYSHKIGIDW